MNNMLFQNVLNPLTYNVEVGVWQLIDLHLL
jgi:hypothetical protein